MSDFGAWACDFHSDFASDFRTESNDYASDFPRDFGGEPRTAKQPPTRTPGNKGGGKLAAKAVSHGAGDNATP